MGVAHASEGEQANIGVNKQAVYQVMYVGQCSGKLLG